MNRPPFRRRDGRRKKPRSARGRFPLRTLAVLLLGYSVLQYASTGTLSWPAALYDTARAALADFAGEDNSGWRRAAGVAQDLGAAREGTPPPDFDFSGRVVRVSDGDTVSVLDRNKQQHKVRLYGIDTPERDQPHGQASRAALDELVGSRQVGVVVVETDDYGRTVGTVYAGDDNVNLAMVAAGHAWWYRYYAPHERHLQAAERAARERRLGLWADSDPVPPWDWRRGRR